MEVFQTKRLLLRELEERDFDDLAQILQDPEVVYAYEHTFSQQDVREWLNRQRARYQKDGFGLWALVWKETGEMVGQAGLTMQQCEGEEFLEIGYLLKKRFWHRGFATEAAEGCKQYAFTILGADRVSSIIKIDNQPSVRVALAIGMKKEKEFFACYYSGWRLHGLYSILR